MTRKLFQTDTCTTELPTPQLLVIHRAVAHLLHLSGAGKYCKIFKSMEDAEEWVRRRTAQRT